MKSKLFFFFLTPKRIYKLQEDTIAFRDLRQFLTKMGEPFISAHRTSLLEQQGFNKRLIDELASIATLTNYGQTTEMSAFVGMISLAGFTKDLWSVRTGNLQVPAKLLELSGAKVRRNTRVHLVAKTDSVSQEDDIRHCKLVYETTEEGVENDAAAQYQCQHTETFDYVIICCPLYDANIDTEMRIELASAAKFKRMQMQHTNTYFVYGKCKLFPGQLPEHQHVQLHSIDPLIPYRTVCK